MGDNLFSMIFHTLDKEIEVEQWDSVFLNLFAVFFFFLIFLFVDRIYLDGILFVVFQIVKILLPTIEYKRKLLYVKNYLSSFKIQD